MPDNELEFSDESEYTCKGSVLKDIWYAASETNKRTIMEFIFNRLALFKKTPDEHDMADANDLKETKEGE